MVVVGGIYSARYLSGSDNSYISSAANLAGATNILYRPGEQPLLAADPRIKLYARQYDTNPHGILYFASDQVAAGRGDAVVTCKVDQDGFVICIAPGTGYTKLTTCPSSGIFILSAPDYRSPGCAEPVQFKVGNRVSKLVMLDDPSQFRGMYLTGSVSASLSFSDSAGGATDFGHTSSGLWDVS